MANIIIIFLGKYLIFLQILAVGIWFFHQSLQIKKQFFFFLAALAVCAGILLLGAHKIYNNPRPFVVGHFTPLIAHGDDNGFPSEHTLLAMTLAFALWPFNKKYSLINIATALLIGTGRVLAGVHHPIDIIGSTLIVIIVFGISFKWLLPKIKAYFSALEVKQNS